jgi:tRNA-Thr(GGU) m(6)t(6)A37 methyltransferase TsaA
MPKTVLAHPAACQVHHPAAYGLRDFRVQDGRMKRDQPRQQETFEVVPIGVLRSELEDIEQAPMQGSEGAPDAWLEVEPSLAAALVGLEPGDDIIVITWFHRSRRDVLQTHPRSDPRNPLTGVFATRSPERPNPLGLHPVTVRAVAGNRLRVGPIEAIDGTPVVDIKPVI